MRLLPGTRERKTQSSMAEGGVSLTGSVRTAFQRSHYNSGEFCRTVSWGRNPWQSCKPHPSGYSFPHSLCCASEKAALSHLPFLLALRYRKLLDCESAPRKFPNSWLPIKIVRKHHKKKQQSFYCSTTTLMSKEAYQYVLLRYWK